MVFKLKAATRSGKTGKDEICQRYENAAEKVKGMIESKRRINTAKVKVSASCLHLRQMTKVSYKFVDI